jgi:nitroreductase
MIEDLIRKNRTYRRFYEDKTVDIHALKELVNLARLSASGGNLQPLKYMLSCEKTRNALIFPHLVWAAYLKDWGGPEEGQRPAAYIIVLCDTRVRQSAECDAGLACQSILLGAVEKGLGGCILGSIKRDALREVLSLAPELEIVVVIALGKPKETVKIDTVGAAGDIKYWRDPHGVHHVPKRSLEEIIIG